MGLSIASYQENLGALLAGGPGSGPHASLLTRGKELGYRLDYWLKNNKGVKVLDIKKELLDPSALTRIQDWTREGKIREWQKAGAKVADMPPVDVVRTKSGDYLFDGTHRTELAQRQGSKIPATVYTILTRHDVTAGGPGSGPHASTLPAEVAQWHKDEVNAWLGIPAGLKITSVKKELLDPNSLNRTQDWTSAKKLADWANEGRRAEKMDPVTVIRTKSGDYLFDGTHRTELAVRQGTKVPALVHTVAFVQNEVAAGGPGSGWTTENGHVKHATIKAANLVDHLQKISNKPLPRFVKTAAKQLEAAGLDQRYFQSRLLTKFRTADKLAIHPLAIANYNESKRLLEFRNDVDAGSVTHELAHHLDLTFTRQPDKQVGDNVKINKEMAAKVITAYTEEYKAAKATLSEAIGHNFRFANDYQKMEKQPGLAKGLPTLYAVDGPKEWFAECFYLYAKGGASRDRLERIAPNTAAAVKTVMTGRIFR